MSFESELSKGEFCIPQCNICKEIVWPPMKFCSNCFGKVSLKKGDFEGKIIEFSQEKDYFCVVEFKDKIRIVARTLQKPKIGQLVKISKCGIKDGDYFFQIN